MKFLHAADIHLDSPLRGLERYEGAPVDEIRGATRKAFDRLIDFAISQGVDFVLIAGDIYDGDWKDYNTGLYFVGCMRKLEAAGIPVYLLAGNHDAASVITRKLRLPDNVHTFSTRKAQTLLVDGLNVAIHGQGFATKAVTDDISQGYPQADETLFNIGMLHTCLDGKPGHDSYAPCTVDGLRSKGYQYWALGHVHVREVVSSDPYIVFPGNIQGRHARETGPKGCTLVTVEDARVVSVEHHDLDVMRWMRCELDVSDCETPDAIHDQVHKALQQSTDDANDRALAVRLILTGSTPAHAQLHNERDRWVSEYRSLASGLAGAGVWLEKVSLNTQAAVSEADLLERDDALAELMDSIGDIDLTDRALELYAEELSPLRTKLPSSLLSGDDAYDPTHPDTIRLALKDVKQLLLNRLLAKGQDA